MRKSLSKVKYLLIPVLLSMQLIAYADTDQGYQQRQQARQNFQVSSKEYETSGRQMVAALSSRDAKAFSQVIDEESLLDRVFDGMSQDTKKVQKIRASLHSALDRVGMIITRNLGENARLTYVRTRSIGQEHRALMRIDLGDRGLNYLDFILQKDKAGAVKIIDWHDYAQGQVYTTSLRQALALLMPQGEKLIERLLGRDKVDKKGAKEFVALSKLSREQRYAEWLKTYNDVSDKVKYSRIILVTRVLISSAVSDKNQYRLALQDVHKYLGGDPTLSLLLIDHYLYEKDFNAAHKALDRLHEYTGGDAAIDAMKANIFLKEKNYRESIKYAQSAIKKDTTYVDAYWSLLDASVYAKQYQTAVKVINQLESNFGYRFNPNKLAKVVGYEGFVKSVAFTEWRGDR